MVKVKETPVIELRNLTKHYGIGDAMHHALDGVDLTIDKGEFITIMGPSGCGKTTLLNILGLLDHTNDGEYILDGTSVENFSSARHARIRSQQILYIVLTLLKMLHFPLPIKESLEQNDLRWPVISLRTSTCRSVNIICPGSFLEVRCNVLPLPEHSLMSHLSF